MIHVLAVFFGLLFSTYTDIKTGYVEDWLSHAMIILGIIMVPIFYPNQIILSYIIGAIVFLAGYLLYIYGNIGGGDVKLFTAIALLIPFYNEAIGSYFSFLGIEQVYAPYPFILSIFLLSGILFMIFISVQYSIKVIRLRKEINDFRKKSLKGLAYALILLPFFYYWSYMSMPMALMYLPVALTCFIMPFKDDFVKFFFAEKKLVSKLNDDDILAIELMNETLKKKLGVKRKTHSLKELIKIKANAKKNKITTVLVCENLPKFVPYIMASFLLNIATGDFFLYVIKTTSSIPYF